MSAIYPEQYINIINEIDNREKTETIRLHFKQYSLSTLEQVKSKQDSRNLVMKLLNGLREPKIKELNNFRSEVENLENKLNKIRTDNQEQRKFFLSHIPLKGLEKLEKERKDKIEKKGKDLVKLDKNSMNYALIKDELEIDKRHLIHIQSEILIAKSEIKEHGTKQSNCLEHKINEVMKKKENKPNARVKPSPSKSVR